MAAGLLQVAGGRISRNHLELRQASWQFYPGFLQSLGLEFERRTHVRLARSLASAEGFVAALRGTGLAAETTTCAALRESGLSLSEQAGEAASLLEVGTVDPFGLLQSLSGELRELGVGWHHQRVERIERTNVIDSNGEVWLGDAVVLACGAGLARLWTPGWDFRLEPGEVSEYRGDHSVVCSLEAPWLGQLWIPCSTGWRSVGNASDLLGFRGQEVWRESATRIFTPDGLPLIGAIADGVYVLGALGRNGLLTAPFLAQTLAGQIVTGDAPSWLSLFSPERACVGRRRPWSN